RNAADVTRQPASYTASPGDFRGTRRVVYALLEEGRDAEAKDAAVACAEFYATKPPIHLRYPGMPGAFIQMLVDTGSHQQAAALARRLFDDVAMHPGYYGVLTARDLRLLAERLDSPTGKEVDRLEEVARLKLKAGRDQPVLAIPEIDELAAMGKALGITSVASEAERQRSAALEMAAAGEAALAPFELKYLLSQINSADPGNGSDREAQVEWGRFMVDRYFAAGGPAWTLSASEWLELCGLVQGLGFRELDASLVSCIESYIKARYTKRITSQGEFDAWLVLLGGLGEAGRPSIERLACSRLGLQVIWGTLSWEVRQAVVADVKQSGDNVVLNSASESWLSRTGLSLTEEIALAAAAAHHRKSEAADLWANSIASRVFGEGGQKDISRPERELAVVVLSRLGYQPEEPARFASDLVEVLLGYEDRPASASDAFYAAVATLLRSEESLGALAEARFGGSGRRLTVAKVEAWQSHLEGDVLAWAKQIHSQPIKESDGDQARARDLLAVGYAASLYRGAKRPRLNGVMEYIPEAIRATEDEPLRVVACEELAAACLINGYHDTALLHLRLVRDDMSNKKLQERLDPWMERLYAASVSAEAALEAREPRQRVSSAIQARQHRIDPYHPGHGSY
ncbi:MAG: hypothetical protein AAGH99_16275, partial [Planctomycetota bacterium]